MFLLDVSTTASNREALFSVRDDRWLTYGELAELVRTTAHELASGRKALVFCLARNDLETVVTYLAAVEAGHAVALLDRSISAANRHSLLEVYAPDFVLDGGVRPMEDELGSGYVLTDGVLGGRLWRKERPSGAPIHPALSLLLTTSGSTGSPKFVRLSQANILANASSIRESLAITEYERAITSLPIFYSYGLSVLNSHLAAGARIVLTEESVLTPAFWDAFRAHDCTSFAGVPYTYQMLERIGLGELYLPTLRTMTQAGGKLSTEAVLRFHALMTERGGSFYVMYGQTEATARIACLASSDLPRKAGSAGRAIPSGRIMIVDEGVEVKQAHRVGEVVYSGPNVMLGYATSRAELAEGDTLGGLLRTGDLGYLDEEGYLFLTGRSKRIGKVFGLRINLDEVEEMLRDRGPTAVIGAEDRLVIFCVHGNEGTFTKYRMELSRSLKIHHRAFEFRRIDSLPLTSSGKVDYQSLRED